MRVCPQGKACDLGLAPKTPQTPEYAFSLNYGYHLNAGKFVELLQRHCVDNLGVEHKLGHVDQVLSAENGDIDALSLTGGEKNPRGSICRLHWLCRPVNWQTLQRTLCLTARLLVQ